MKNVLVGSWVSFEEFMSGYVLRKQRAMWAPYLLKFPTQHSMHICSSTLGYPLARITKESHFDRNDRHVCRFEGRVATDETMMIDPLFTYSFKKSVDFDKVSGWLLSSLPRNTEEVMKKLVSGFMSEFYSLRVIYRDKLKASHPLKDDRVSLRFMQSYLNRSQDSDIREMITEHLSLVEHPGYSIVDQPRYHMRVAQTRTLKGEDLVFLNEAPVFGIPDKYREACGMMKLETASSKPIHESRGFRFYVTQDGVIGVSDRATIYVFPEKIPADQR